MVIPADFDWQAMFNMFAGQPPTREAIKQYVLDNYPQMAWALADKELGPILEKAAKEKWSPGRFEGALLKTKWYKTQTEAERNWAVLIHRDPKTANTQLMSAMQMVTTIASQVGATLAPAEISKIALSAAQSGWDDGRVTAEVARRTRYKEDIGGTVGGLADKLLGVARGDYMTAISPQTAFRWAQKIMTGEASEDGFMVYIRDAAKSKFPTLVKMINDGNSVKDIVNPYIEQTAQLLEVAPQNVNMWDPRFAKMIDQVDGQGNRRMMSLDEAAQHVRQTREWKGTKNAEDMAASFGENFLRQMGEVA